MYVCIYVYYSYISLHPKPTRSPLTPPLPPPLPPPRHITPFRPRCPLEAVPAAAADSTDGSTPLAQPAQNMDQVGGISRIFFNGFFLLFSFWV